MLRQMLLHLLKIKINYSLEYIWIPYIKILLIFGEILNNKILNYLSIY